MKRFSYSTIPDLILVAFLLASAKRFVLRIANLIRKKVRMRLNNKKFVLAKIAIKWLKSGQEVAVEFDHVLPICADEMDDDIEEVLVKRGKFTSLIC